MDKNIIYYPLTHPQKGIWYTEKLYPDTSIGNIAAILKLKDSLDFNLFNQAINLLIQKNDSLRLRFTEKNGEPLQYITEYVFKDIEYFDFSNDGLDKIYNWDSIQARTPFNLIDSPLCYFAVLKINDNEFGFYAKLHHLISDGWSIVQLGNIVLDYYFKFKNNIRIREDINKSYLEFINGELQYKESERFRKDKEYWDSEFSSLIEITTLKNSTSINDLRAKRKTFVVPDKMSLKIRQYCKDNNTSIFSLFISALCIYINRITSKEDIIIGVPVLNRVNSKEKDTLGMFVSTIPLRIKLNNDMDFKEFSCEMTNKWFSVLRHQKYPYELILKKVRESNKNIEKLFDISLSYQNAKFIKNGDPDRQEARWHFNGFQNESLYIHINDREDDGNLILDFDFNSSLFKIQEIEFIYDHLTRLLWHTLDNSARKLPSIEMISEKERHKVLYEFNYTSAKYPKNKTIHQLFEEQANKTPHNIALVFEDKTMTYAELNKKSNQLAQYLREIGVKADTVVGILIKRSMEMIVSILAVLKAGGAYLPIDPDYPKSRIDYMLEDSNTTILLTDKSHDELNKQIKNTINIFDFESFDNDADNLSNINSSRDAAYFIYTSGSTGKPKGVVIEHRSVINFISGMAKVIDFSSLKTIISLTTICFDIFVLESLLPLVKGLKVIIANEQQQKLPELLKDILLKNKVNIIQITPSRLQILLNSIDENDYFEHLSEMLIGGETFPETLLDKIRSISNANIYNMYGPTETTVWSTVKNIEDIKSVNIGKPIINTQIYILDKYLNPAPIGVPGKLYIGGDGLSRGYYNKPELNESKFINNPFKEDEKIYDTGDLARWCSQGDIQHLGRVDNQIKINGFRIELGEIEYKLLKHKYIKEAVVVDRVNKNGNAYLCAYIVTSRELLTSDIKLFLLNDLPYYMVPTCFVEMDSMPTTPNGKVDKLSLPEPNVDFLNSDNYEEYRNNTDKKLLDVWTEIFKKNRIGINDSFFALGGDSLTIIQLQSTLIKYGINIHTQDIYKYQTIKELSNMLTVKNNIKIDVTNNSNIINIKDNDLLDNDEMLCDKQVGNILLTGATGFLGIHLLENIIKNSESNCYCLIRGESQENAELRLIKLLNYYFNGRFINEIRKRIHVINGDIVEENFGLSDYNYKQLLERIDTVINSAALVKHYGFYDDFYKVNVESTENIVKFCLYKKIVLHHISTINVAGNHLLDSSIKSRFTENDFFIGQSYQDNVYVRSKFEAEQIIFNNIDKGLKTAIYRVGVLTGRYKDGLFQMNMGDNGFYRRIKSIIEFGLIQESLINQKVEFTPVDYCSNAIQKLMSVKVNKCKIYHVLNHKMITIGNIVKILNDIGYEIEYITDESFKNEVLRIASNIKLNTAIEGIVNDLKNNSLNYESYIKIDSNKTLKYLKNMDFEWPGVSGSYIMRLLDFMMNVNFIDRPKENVHAQIKKFV